MQLKYSITFAFIVTLFFMPINELWAIHTGTAPVSIEKSKEQTKSLKQAKKDKRSQVKALKKQKRVDRLMQKMAKHSNGSGVGFGLAIILVGAVIFVLGLFGIGTLLLALGLVILAFGLVFWLLGSIF